MDGIKKTYQLNRTINEKGELEYTVGGYTRAVSYIKYLQKDEMLENINTLDDMKKIVDFVNNYKLRKYDKLIDSNEIKGK